VKKATMDNPGGTAVIDAAMGGMMTHQLRQGESCDWWIGWDVGSNAKRDCFKGGGMGFETECSCPAGSTWSQEKKACTCDSNVSEQTGKKELGQGENCFGA
jgi:hypothetical protein